MKKRLDNKKRGFDVLDIKLAPTKTSKRIRKWHDEKFGSSRTCKLAKRLDRVGPACQQVTYYGINHATNHATKHKHLRKGEIVSFLLMQLEVLASESQK